MSSSRDEFTRLVATLPVALQQQIAGYTPHELEVGHSHMRVFRLERGAYGPFYLKVAEGGAGDLRRERDRLAWLRGRLPVPEVTGFAEDVDRQVMLMTGLPGVPAFDAQLAASEPARVIRLLAEGLREIHRVPIDTCPFDATVDTLIKRAIDHIAAGRVVAGSAGGPYAGRSAEELLTEVLVTRPRSEDLVFAHGDYCMPNILVTPQDVALGGFVDWGSAGVADRYLDLALAARSIAYNWGEAWVQPFFDAYGIAAPDADRIAFFQLIDELAWVP